MKTDQVIMDRLLLLVLLLISNSHEMNQVHVYIDLHIIILAEVHSTGVLNLGTLQSTR